MKVITICSSLKYIEEIQYYTEKLELEGNCVLGIIYPTKNKENYTPEEIRSLEIGHIKKIDLSDAIFVINKNGYIGDSVKREIEHAKRTNKEVMYLENNGTENNIITYNKLIRDKIIQIIEGKGNKAIYDILCKDNYTKELNHKLMEEVYEFMMTHETEELADIMEVLYSIIDDKNLEVKDIEEMMLKKREEKGGFKNKIFLKQVIE